ncbi:MAG TPA: tol-pal system protein YbgF [Paracoccaceae bacterium]|nr:tol-pal system protein YbgF [Paracoccaceae bacterium]
MRAGLTLAGAFLIALLPLAAPAQDRAQTLADIRQELALLQGQVLSLRSELATTGGAMGTPATGTTLERLDTLEAALRDLTSKTEALEFRINGIVTDGTNRIGDIEFRLQELAGGDLGALPPTPPLGGQAPTVPVAPAPVAPGTGGPQLALSEQADFDRARAAYDGGDYRGAAEQFATFAQTYTGGPLTQEAHFLRGEAFWQLGETANAARAYLEAFSGGPEGARAPEALLKLGQALAQLGQGPEACVTLQEVGTRYPGTQPAADAASALRAFGCQ